MWQEQDNKLVKDFSFKDFKEAFAFMTEVAFYAENRNHHPEWFNVYNRVNISLTTHDSGNTITAHDRDLAVIIDQVFTKYQR
jgi:4a-hydroxytetrahydrobiopterin dehydratase